MLFQDARDYQILFLSLFLFLGISSRDWTIRPGLMVVVMVSCLLTQTVLSVWVNFTRGVVEYSYPINYSHTGLLSKIEFYFPQRRKDAKECAENLNILASWRSAIITGLGLCLLLRANNYQTMALAGFFAIASKFLFRFRGKHFFNPANFGIIGALIFTSDAWVSPGQWGTDWWYLLLFLGTGGMVLKKVGRWDTSAAFFLTYIGLEAIRNYWIGWSWDVLLHQMTSGSLLLFALFMLTDPRSIPNASTSRLIWAISIAVATFILQHIFYIPTAIFWALFIFSPFTLFLDYLWSDSRFTWKTQIVNS